MVAGIKTLDTSIIGAIAISGIVTALHNRLFDRQLPVFLGIFQGSSFVTIVAFFVMIPCAWLTLLGWPKVQMGIASLQEFMLVSGPLGVWVYTFLERILIPTGLHHFIYGPSSSARPRWKAASSSTGPNTCWSSARAPGR